MLDGVSSPLQNVIRAQELGATSSAITDHGFVSGIFEQYFACKERGIKPLLGCELYMREKLDDDSNKYYHGIFIATNKKGFENILRLSSLGCSDHHWKERRPVVSFEEVFDHSEGLIFTTACMIGIVGTNQKKKCGEKKSGGAKYEEYTCTIAEANRMFLMFKKVFAGRMFVEIGPAQVNHDFDGKTRKFNPRPVEHFQFGYLSFDTNCLQEEHNRRAILMARLHDLPVVIGTDAHMSHPRLKKIQDLMMSSAPDNHNGFHFFQTHASLPPEELWAEFQKNHPYISEEMFRQAIDNSYKLDALVENFDLEFKPLMPEFPLRLLEQDPYGPAMAFASCEEDSGLNKQELTRHWFCRRYDGIFEPGMTSRQFMMALVKKIGRLPEKREYYERLKEEIHAICDNGILDFTDYFLVLADIMQAAKELGVGVGPARGSAGGCLLAYLLGITAIDPIKHNLSFVRFFNVGRLGKLDIDFTKWHGKM